MTFVMGGKPNGVVDIIQLNSREFIPPSADKVIFVVRPELDVIRSLIYQKQGFKTEKDIYILYVPRRTIECDEELEKAGVRYCPLNIISSCMTRKRSGRYPWI
jgi:hypothetical protein